MATFLYSKLSCQSFQAVSLESCNHCCTCTGFALEVIEYRTRSFIWKIINAHRKPAILLSLLPLLPFAFAGPILRAASAERIDDPSGFWLDFFTANNRTACQSKSSTSISSSSTVHSLQFLNNCLCRWVCRLFSIAAYCWNRYFVFKPNSVIWSSLLLEFSFYQTR